MLPVGTDAWKHLARCSHWLGFLFFYRKQAPAVQSLLNAPTFIIQSFLHQEVCPRHTWIPVSLLPFELLPNCTNKVSFSLFTCFLHSADTHWVPALSQVLLTHLLFLRLMCESETVLITAECDGGLSNTEASLCPDKRFWKAAPELIHEQAHCCWDGFLCTGQGCVSTSSEFGAVL